MKPTVEGGGGGRPFCLPNYEEDRGFLPPINSGGSSQGVLDIDLEEKYEDGVSSNETDDEQNEMEETIHWKKHSLPQFTESDGTTSQSIQGMSSRHSGYRPLLRNECSPTKLPSIERNSVSSFASIRSAKTLTNFSSQDLLRTVEDSPECEPLWGAYEEDTFINDEPNSIRNGDLDASVDSQRSEELKLPDIFNTSPTRCKPSQQYGTKPSINNMPLVVQNGHPDNKTPRVINGIKPGMDKNSDQDTKSKRKGRTIKRSKTMRDENHKITKRGGDFKISHSKMRVENGQHVNENINPNQKSNAGVLLYDDIGAITKIAKANGIHDKS